jgi:hypothetical protein
MTDHRPDFEDVPVVRLARPRDAQRVQAAVVVIIAILGILIVKPWGETRRPTTALASPSVAPSRPAGTPRPIETVRPDGARVYEPGLFGRYSVTPRWELWPTAYVYRFALSGPLPIGSGAPPTDEPSGSPPEPTPTPVEPPPDAAQLVDVGSTDLLMVLGLNTPAGSRILDARLWRFPPTGAPVRMALRELPPPWPVDTFHVYGLRVADDDDPDLVASWPAGVYRFDLLVDPGAQIRRIGLLVRPPTGSSGGAPAPAIATPTPTTRLRDATDLADLVPDESGVANRVVLDNPGGSWIGRDLPDPQGCGLTEIWLAELDRPGGPCSAIVVSDVTFAAVDLGRNRPVRALRIDQVDPVGARVPVVDRTDGTPGADRAPGWRAVETADGRALPEGTYRLIATLRDGSELGWYVRVLPAGGGGG